MINDLGEAQLTRLFGLFSTRTVVGVKILNSKNGYGIWLKKDWEKKEVDIYEYMAIVDADWEIVQDEFRTWHVYKGGDKVELADNNYFSFSTKEWYVLLDKIFDLFKKEFFNELSKDAQEYIR